MEFVVEVGARGSDAPRIVVAKDYTQFAALPKRLPETQARATAYHEAGHAVVNDPAVTGQKLTWLTILGDVGNLGFALYDDDEDRPVHVVDRRRAVLRLARLMAGQTAMTMAGFAPDAGWAADLRAARQLARRMILEWGLDPEFLGVAPAHDTGRNDDPHLLSQRQIDRLSDTIVRLLAEALTEAAGRARPQLGSGRGAGLGPAEARLRFRRHVHPIARSMPGPRDRRSSEDRRRRCLRASALASEGDLDGSCLRSSGRPGGRRVRVTWGGGRGERERRVGSLPLGRAQPGVGERQARARDTSLAFVAAPASSAPAERVGARLGGSPMRTGASMVSERSRASSERISSAWIVAASVLVPRDDDAGLVGVAARLGSAGAEFRGGDCPEPLVASAAVGKFGRIASAADSAGPNSGGSPATGAGGAAGACADAGADAAADFRVSAVEGAFDTAGSLVPESIATVAVNPATRRMSSGTASRRMRTGTRWASRTKVKIGLTVASPDVDGAALGTLMPRATLWT